MSVKFFRVRKIFVRKLLRDFQSTMELFCDYTKRCTTFAIKYHHRCSTGFYTVLQKYRNFQSDAKVEQIILIFTTRSISCCIYPLFYPGNIIQKMSK